MILWLKLKINILLFNLGIRTRFSSNWFRGRNGKIYATCKPAGLTYPNCFRCDKRHREEDVRIAEGRQYIYCSECREAIRRERVSQAVNAGVELMDWPEFI